MILSSRSEEKLRAVAAAVVRSEERRRRAAGAASGKGGALPPPPPAPTVLPFDALAPYAKLEEAAARAAEASREAWAEEERGEEEAKENGPSLPPRLSLLVLCAGASQHAAAASTTAEVSDALLELNAAAPIRLARAALPHLLETADAAAKKLKGTSLSFPPAASILGVSSMAALVPSPGQAAYSASKAALALYLRSVEAELFDRGFRTTTVYPGPLSSSSSSSSSTSGTENSNDDDEDNQIFSTTAVRTVYGSAGLKQEGAEAVSSKAKEDSKRLEGGRAAALIVAAGYSGLGEALLGKHPVLLLGHLARGSLFPGSGGGLAQRLLRKVLTKVGPARAAALEEGRGGYDAGALLSSSAGGAAAAAGAGGKKRA